jgi:phospholipase C
MSRLIALVVAMLSTAGSDSGRGTPPRVQRVVTVVLENTDYERALAQPFLAQLARSGGLLTNFSAVSSPSQPNYFALTAGSTFGASNDPVTLDVRHIGDLVEAKGQTWKVYAEEYSGHCDTRSQSGNYVRRHQPFISFKNVQTNPARCNRIVNAAEFWTDVARGALPNYALYIPDLANSGHETGVTWADRWLGATFGPLLQDPRFRHGTLLIITFDEGRRSNHVYTVVWGDAVAPGSTSSTAYDHYSVLRTTEHVLGLRTLKKADVRASIITGVWR